MKSFNEYITEEYRSSSPEHHTLQYNGFHGGNGFIQEGETQKYHHYSGEHHIEMTAGHDGSHHYKIHTKGVSKPYEFSTSASQSANEIHHHINHHISAAGVQNHDRGSEPNYAHIGARVSKDHREAHTSMFKNAHEQLTKHGFTHAHTAYGTSTHYTHPDGHVAQVKQDLYGYGVGIKHAKARSHEWRSTTSPSRIGRHVNELAKQTGIKK